jgi:hypothetical protein
MNEGNRLRDCLSGIYGMEDAISQKMEDVPDELKEVTDTVLVSLSVTGLVLPHLMDAINRVTTVPQFWKALESTLKPYGFEVGYLQHGRGSSKVTGKPHRDGRVPR